MSSLKHILHHLFRKPCVTDSGYDVYLNRTTVLRPGWLLQFYSFAGLIHEVNIYFF